MPAGSVKKQTSHTFSLASKNASQENYTTVQIQTAEWVGFACCCPWVVVGFCVFLWVFCCCVCVFCFVVVAGCFLSCVCVCVHAWVRVCMHVCVRVFLGVALIRCRCCYLSALAMKGSSLRTLNAALLSIRLAQNSAVGVRGKSSTR